MKAIRSLLFVPASRPRMLAKVSGLAADAALIDLEDGVPPAEKEAAREHVREAARRGRLDGGPLWMLRLNPADSFWHDADLDLAAELRPGVTVLPKAEHREPVRRLCRRCTTWGGTAGLMIETARGVGRVRELAGAHPRVEILILGSADLRRSLGARPERGRSWESLALQEILLAARMHDCLAIDSVYFRYKDEQGLREHGRFARELGYDGKSCIHPDQIEPIHDLFSSTAGETAWAHAVREAWRDQRGESRGVVVLDGEMIESLHVAVAERILARARRSGAAEEPGREGAPPDEG